MSQFANDSNLFSPAERLSGADLETRIREFYELARTNSLVIEPESIQYRSRSALYALGCEAFVRLSTSLTGPMTRVRYVEFVEDSTPDPVQVNTKALNLVTTGAGSFVGVDLTQGSGQFGWILIDGHLPLAAPESNEYPAYFELSGGVLVKVGAGQGAFVKYLRNDLTHFLPMDPGILELQQDIASQLAQITAAQTQLGTLSEQVTGLLGSQVSAAEFEALRSQIQAYADNAELALDQTRTIQLATAGVRDQTQILLNAVITQKAAIDATEDSITAIKAETLTAQLSAANSANASIETLYQVTVKAGEAGVAAESAITASLSATASGEFSESQAIISTTKAAEASASAASAVLTEQVAARVAIETFPSDFIPDDRFFSGLVGSSEPAGIAGAGVRPTTSYSDAQILDTTNGRALRFGVLGTAVGYKFITPRKRLAVVAVAGRRYRLTAKVRLNAYPPTGTTIAYLNPYGLTADFNTIVYSGHMEGTTPTPGFAIGASLTSGGSIYTLSMEMVTKAVPTPDVYGNTAAWLVPALYFGNEVASLGDMGQPEVLSLEFEDITESYAALVQAGISTTKAAEASASAASALTSETLAASITPNMRNKDPFMTRWTDIYNLAEWQVWSGTSNRVAGFQAQYSNNLPNAAGVQGGVTQFIQFSPGWWVEEMEVTLNSGTLRGVGVHTHSSNDALGATATGDYSLTDFWSRIGDGVVGRTYRIGVIREWTAPCIRARHYAMTHWGGFLGTGGDYSAANDVTIRFCGIRPATEMEIRDKTVLAPLQATVTTQAGAIVDLEGRTEAFWEVTAVAGGRAQVRVFADANGGGGVDIVGDTKISGNLLVTGSVTYGELAANSASNGGVAYNAGSVSLTTSWQDAAEVTITTIGGACKIDFSSYVVGQGVGSGTNVNWRLLRNGAEIKSGTLMLFPGEQTVYGGTVGENPYPVYTPVAGMFPVFHVDTSPGSGSVTYKIQLKLFIGSVSFADFAERTISVTEFRR